MSPIAIVSIILLLVFAGFLAASESALTSISRIVIDAVANNWNTGVSTSKGE